MSTEDMDFLARKIVGLEAKHNALARARQIPSSSVRLVDGTDVVLQDGIEIANDSSKSVEQLETNTYELGSIGDTEAENSVEIPDWIVGSGEASDVAWESTQYAIDLAAQLEADLGPLPGQIQEALDEAAEAKQTALDAAADAATAESAANAAATAASIADGKAVAAQTAAGNAQSAADDAAADALAAANAASAAQTTADSKGKTIIQSAAPATADRLPQNLWIDTTGGANTPKRWNGTAWVAVTDKAATDAAAAAVTAQNRANEAFDEAVAAATAAGNAQTSADNKNRVWYQTTAPAGTGHSVGDTWFDTDDGNSIYRWSGSAWVRAQLGTNSLTDSAVNAAKLANNAVTSAKVAADAITDAKLAPAVRDSITTAQSTASNAQTIANGAASAASAAQTTANNANTAATNAANAASAAQTTANNAADAAAEADQKALDAAGIANGKGKVIIQSAAPATADRLPQNLWIDTTSNANTPKRWNGTAWVAVTDKAATDAASAAVAAQTTATNAASAAATADGKAVAAQNAANAAQSTANSAQTIANGAATAASAAQNTADAAQTAANNAQTTANGKNKIVRSTSAASGTGYIAGDQWWQYSGTQIIAMWIHSGSAWVSQTLTDSVITNLNAGSITAGTLNAARIGAASITGAHIAGATITAANMVTGTITAASGIIADAAIGSAKIIDGAIITAKIGDAQITNAKIANLDAAKITTGTLNADRIGANSITAAKMVVGTITAASGIIADAAITNAKIANLDAAKIDTGTLNAARIGAGSIVAEKLATGAVTTDKILANAITTAKLAATAIDGMTITGALIRTAATGQRVQLDVNGLRTFNSGNTETARLASDGTGLRLIGPLMSVSGDGTAAVKLDIGLVELTSNLGTGWTDRTALTAGGLTTNNDSQLTISNTSNEAGTGVGIVSGSGPSDQAYLVVRTGTGATNSSISFSSNELLHNNRPVYSKEGTGTIALASGSSATAATTLWKVSDGVVWFNITITRTSWTTGGVTTLGTMPTGFRPVGATVTFPAITFGAGAPYNSFVQISTGGTILANNSPTNGQFWNVAFIGFFRT